MKLTTVLFDLDGTLLPMDQDQFIKGYFGALIRKFAPLGYDPTKMQSALMAGIGAMIKNNGSMTNEADLMSMQLRLCAGFGKWDCVSCWQQIRSFRSLLRIAVSAGPD